MPSSSPPYAFFASALLISLGLTTLEGLAGITSGQLGGPMSLALVLLYVAAPILLAGVLLGLGGAALLTVWGAARERRPFSGSRATGEGPGRVAVKADISAFLLAILAFAVVLFIGARWSLGLEAPRRLSAVTLALATPPLGLTTLYLWAILRKVLTRLDARLGASSSALLGLSAFAFALSLLLTTFVREDAFEHRLDRWVLLFVAIAIIGTLALTLTLRRWRPTRGQKGRIRRYGVFIGLFSALSLADLSTHLNHDPVLKEVLLNHTLVFRPFLDLAQPFFDRDLDGYAALFGGGDCDDEDPSVHPGAAEIPRNGVDDDCFGGDSPGPYLRQAPTKPARREHLVERPNIILITVDTLRADHVGFLGYTRPTTPHLDALAAGGVRFTRAYAQAPQTKASVPSVFTGRYYSEVDRSPDIWARVHDENDTLAERLADIGYLTAGVPSHRFFLPNYGLNQGFKRWDLTVVERYGQRMPHVSADEEVIDRALAFLQSEEAKTRPFFLWIHCFNPHHFYQRHEEYDFGSDDIDLYDAEIRATDEALSRLFAHLDEAGFTHNTYTILHSDHAEAFGEHGYLYHGQHLYDDQLHTPLLILGPGLEPATIHTPVANLDIAPTILDLVGAPIPPGLRGVSLVDYTGGHPPPSHPPIFAEMVKDETHSARRVIIAWPWKLHYAITYNRYALFDLSEDPTEQRDLSRSKPLVFEDLKERLRRWMSEEIERSAPRP